MRNISKYIFLNSLDCHYRGWVMRREEAKQPLSMSEQLRMNQGKEVGRRARDLCPGGILVDERNLTAAVEKTRNLMADSSVPAIYEAAFYVDSYATRVDVLKRSPHGWHLIEVKSGFNENPDYIDDVTYTTLVLDRSGIEVCKASLLLLSRDYRLGMDHKDLFRELDCTEKVFSQRAVFRSLWNNMRDRTGGPEPPERVLKLVCRNCELFRRCVGEGIDYHIFDLPRLSKKSFDRLVEMGIESIRDIPHDFPLTGHQVRVRNCVRSHDVVTNRHLMKALEAITWPARYLDFETVSTAIPLYPGVAPHEHILTQFSIHTCDGIGSIISHCEYLADPARDCRREIAESMLKCLGRQGSIIIYSPFERERIQGLIKDFPDLADRLSSLLNRLVDLEAIVRKHVNHPDFHGRTSIKLVLPALVPEMVYDDMEISEGGDASAWFACLALGEFVGREEEIRKNLLEYCRQDTLGMVRLHERLLKSV